jgi:hypothetical protein
LEWNRNPLRNSGYSIHEKLQALKLAELKAAIQAGIDSGPGVPAEEVFERLEQKYAAKAKGRSA